MKNELPCKVCFQSGKRTRTKLQQQNKTPKYYSVYICTDCEKQKLYEWRKQNPDKWSALLNKSYIKTTEGLVSRRNNMNHTEESRAQWARDKTNRRCGRAKQAKFTDELTQLVTIEAHDLRKRRNLITGFDWHVDHIIPLKGKTMCGLHIWSNLQVIPKILNLRKGNKEMVNRHT